MSELSAVDLNLIGPLDALLRERHVSRAADALNMSQPAMSRALRSLRGVFGDELLVRAPGGYRLTPRAERLQRDLATTLPQLASLFSDDPYDPRHATPTFQIAGSDYLLELLVPELIAIASTESPGCTVRLGPWNENVYRDVERGAIDLALAGPYGPLPLQSQTLFNDDYRCVLASTHPLADREALTLDDYLGYRHAVVDIAGGRQGAVDRHLDELGRPRRTSTVVPFHALAARAVQRTTLIATLPTRLVDDLRRDASVVVRRAPAEIESMNFAMTWHPRLSNDPAHRWLREIVGRAAVRLDERHILPG